MISLLHKNHISPQAIEQPWDMSVPENKLMLAIYLSTPEVENERRALKYLPRYAESKKEGRLMGIAPYGYFNKTHKDGKKYIAIREPEASNIRWAFSELAKGHIPADHVILQMNKRDGISMGRSAFAKAMRNPVYCRKIYIEDYKQEEAYYTDDKHEALITERFFNQVQKVMDKKSRRSWRKNVWERTFSTSWSPRLSKVVERILPQVAQRESLKPITITIVITSADSDLTLTN